MLRGTLFLAGALAGFCLARLLSKPVDNASDEDADWNDPFVPPALLSLGAVRILGGGMRTTPVARFYPDLSRFALANDRTRHLCLCGCKRDCGVILTIEHGSGG